VLRGPIGADLLCEVEAVLVSERDVDERYIGPERSNETKRFSAVLCDADNVHSFSPQERAGGLEERCVVIDDEATEMHCPRMADYSAVRAPANGNSERLLAHVMLRPARFVAQEHDHGRGRGRREVPLTSRDMTAALWGDVPASG
jgi:hypothetical protein